MIAIDISSWIAFFSDVEPAGDDTALVESALATLLGRLPLLAPHPGYWTRAGQLRAKLLVRRHRARLADTLVAQSCLDHGVRLVTRDADFRHFARLGGLRLAL